MSELTPLQVGTITAWAKDNGIANVPTGQPARAKLPAFSWADEFMGKPLPDPPVLIEGILHQGSKLVLGGSSKSFKTWTLLDMAISVSSGSNWLGFPTSKANVLYLNLEIQDRFMQKRIGCVREAKGLEKTPGLAIWNLRGYCADIASLAREIIFEAVCEGFRLIIIDPIYKVGGARVENATEDVADMLNELERIAVQSGAAVAFGAHFSKGNQAAKESIDRISGSGVFARDPDAILIFTAHEETGAFTVEPTLRNFPPCEAFVVRWQFPLMHRDYTLDPARLKKPKTGREARFAVSDLLDCLGNGEMKTTEYRAKVMEETGMSKSTFHNLLKSAEEEGKLSKSKRSEKWSAVQ